MANQEDVLKLAVGRWPAILQEYGVSEKAVSGKHAPCPKCEGVDRFRMIQRDGQGRWICNQCGSGDGMDLLLAVSGLSFKKACEWLRPKVSSLAYVPPNSVSPTDRKNRNMSNVKIWQEAVGFDGLEKDSLLDRYLGQRRLIPEEYSMADLRLHPGLPYYDEDGKAKGLFPAMLARVSTRDGKLASIHRTYLHEQKDGTIIKMRKMTPSSRDWKSGCVRLMSTAGHTRLIVAEGIETALSMRAIMYRRHGMKVPVWAAINADALTNIAIPDEIKQVIIGGDNDTSFTGQKAAYALANRMVVHDKRKAKVVIPETTGWDWNDQLCLEEKG
jgi:putative DNA primase/helicase